MSSALLLLAMGLACGGDEEPDTGAAAVSGDDGPAWCDTAGDVGWEDFGHGFLLTHCQGCHGSQSPNRYGAPESVVFDTEQDAADRAADILRVVIDSQTMPPAGGVSDSERELLQTWLSCSY